MKTFQEMTGLFEVANTSFLSENKELFQSNISERSLCGALMLQLHELIRNDDSFSGYYVDVEYNRNNGLLKTICKTSRGANMQVVKITCDLVLHSRGEHPEQDNLIALEMKKSSARNATKQSDRERLKALTKDSFDDIWSYDGKTLPKHVCRYVLGVYYEINYLHHRIDIEYYHKGNCVNTYSLPLRLSSIELSS